MKDYYVVKTEQSGYVYEVNRGSVYFTTDIGGALKCNTQEQAKAILELSRSRSTDKTYSIIKVATTFEEITL